MSKLNLNCPFLWQRPSSGRLHYTEQSWFDARRIGHNPIDSFMKTLSEEANLDGKNLYTNHSIHATCIRNLDRKGFEARHITAVSGHRNEATIREYSLKCPDTKKKEMFSALASHMDQTVENVQQKREVTSTIVSANDQPEGGNVNIEIPQANESINLPSFNLFEMDNTDEKLFYRILTEVEENLNVEKNAQNDNSAPKEKENQQQIPLQMPAIPPPPPPPAPTAESSKPKETPQNLQQIQQNTVSNVHNNPTYPFGAKMFFANSNVTINHTFPK